MIDVVAGTQIFSLAYEKKQGVRALSPHLATSFGNGKYSSFPKTTVMYMVPVFPMKKKMDMFTPRYSGTYAHRTLGDPNFKTGTHPYHFQVGG